MKDINNIFNDFMLSMVNEKNATLIQELRVRWRHYLGQVSYPLPEPKPIQRTPLFKTKDGVDVFEGDQCYWYYLRDNEIAIPCTTIELRHKYFGRPDGIWFKSLENAQEYRLMNKPCLSANDVLGIIRTINDGAKGYDTRLYFTGKLSALAKQKLDKQ